MKSNYFLVHAPFVLLSQRLDVQELLFYYREYLNEHPNFAEQAFQTWLEYPQHALSIFQPITQCRSGFIQWLFEELNVLCKNFDLCPYLKGNSHHQYLKLHILKVKELLSPFAFRMDIFLIFTRLILYYILLYQKNRR